MRCGYIGIITIIVIIIIIIIIMDYYVAIQTKHQ